MVRLCLNIFDSTWCQGIIEAILSLYEDLRVPLPEMYMDHPPGSLVVANIPRRPALVIRVRVSFNMAWPKMESCFHFLLGWRKINVNFDQGWLNNYLSLFKSYIHLGVGFGNLDRLDFCTPNIEKTSRERSSFEFPPNFQAENPNDVVEVIMVFWKK